ncbi:cytochrome P450 [Pisolithus orientalis]|uniref:cytochrome P450 n=1 Tax=Pisolithus orientalis TaxID=936130 RepID=UPI002224B01B|nr:cytochrome P450 [Pisolithus orientalis]KAI6006539.1 cytochrome P450 [Pisolithus orientalis]
MTCRTRLWSKLPYPPGPKGLPFIGNALDIDRKRPHLTYAQWGKTYGDIVYTRSLGQDIVVVNSEKTARILADGRSAIYADRFRSSIFRIYGTDRMTPVLEYGNEWKTHRRLFHLSLRNDVVDKYNDLHLTNANQLLENILRDSANLFEHFDLFAGAAAVELIYGRRVEGKDDPVFAMASGLAEVLCRELTPDRVVLLKILKVDGSVRYLPSWFPGAGFKRNAAKCRGMAAEMAELPFAMAKDEMTGTILKTVALVMILYPDVQDKVHEELDAVVGRGTLPTFADRPRLPYLQAVLYEVMRWSPPSPLGLPHVTTASDTYEGYYIPKEPGDRAMAMKDQGYGDPERFDPTRHLTSDGQLSPQARQNNSMFFGFGKRVCPGRFFAEHSHWAAAAVMLSALKFGKAKDSSGKYIDVEPVFSDGLTRCPAPFPCSITRRLVE